MRNNSVNLFRIWACGSGGQVKSFKRILVWSSGSPPFQWSRTIYALLKKGIMGNIHVKLYEIWTSGSGDVQRFIYNFGHMGPGTRCCPYQ